jgi:hypothetical protein
MAYDHLEIEARWGTILGEDNERMSKSRGNVVNPDDIGREYGADALRLYEMFMGPLEAVKPWQTSQIQGVSGFGAALALVGSNFLGNSWVDAEPQGLTHLKGLPARAVAPEAAGPYSTEWWPSRWRRTGTRNPARCGARVAYGINASGDGDDGEMHRSRELT